MNSLSNRVAVITGSSGGIGKAIAQALAARGSIVCLVGRRTETLQAVLGTQDKRDWFSILLSGGPRY